LKLGERNEKNIYRIYHPDAHLDHGSLFKHCQRGNHIRSSGSNE
jgi:hypothetical protein